METIKIFNYGDMKRDFTYIDDIVCTWYLSPRCRKHHISIPELATIFTNKSSQPITDIPDLKHSASEPHYHAYGWTTTGKYVMVWYTYRNGEIRIIGGRKLE